MERICECKIETYSLCYMPSLYACVLPEKHNPVTHTPEKKLGTCLKVVIMIVK